MAKRVKLGPCKKCGEVFVTTDAALYKVVGKLARKERKGPAVSAQVLTPCRWCGGLCNATFKRLHEPRCIERPKDLEETRGRPAEQSNASYLAMARKNPHFTVSGGVVSRNKSI